MDEAVMGGCLLTGRHDVTDDLTAVGVRGRGPYQRASGAVGGTVMAEDVYQVNRRRRLSGGFPAAPASRT